MKQKFLTLILVLIACIGTLCASNTSVGGIWYDFKSSSKTASVTYRGSYYSSYEGEYSGSVTIPETVTYNGTTYSVTSIGHDAFYGCSSLTSITIPNSVTSIEWDAFYGCSSLTSVTIPESVTSIGDYAFNGCSSLTSVTINSDAIVSKNYSSFSNISDIFGSQVTEYIIGDNVRGIGDYAFYGCSSLTSVTIPDSVTSIGYAAFADCSSLSSVTIGASVTSIGDYAFYGCSSLTSVTIGESVTSIGDYAFYGCSSLTSVTIPDSVTSIGYVAFADCSSLSSVTIPNSVTSIGNSAFYGCSSLTSVTIPDSVTSIGYAAFADCSSLRSITIPNSVTSIGEDAFADCSSLRSITIPNSVTSIGWGAFSGCSSLRSITIPNSVTSIRGHAFSECFSLTSVTIGNSVTSIGENAFYDCSKLTKTNYTGDIAGWCNIKFGSGSANPMCCSHNFYINDQEIKDLVIPNSVTSIGDYAFYGCSSLTSVTIPDSVTSIGYAAFRNCSSLSSVTIGASVTSIGEDAFYDCSSLTSVTIPNSVTTIGESAFENCSSLTSVTIPNSVTTIGESAFSSCHSLTSVTIPNSVTTIGESAFSSCHSLTSVTIGNSVTSIGKSAFENCSSLTYVTCEAETPPTVGYDAFDGVSKWIPVYVPCGCVEAYKAASGWKNFTNIQEPLAEYSIEVDVNDNIMGTAKVDRNSACGNQISATPKFGYHFVQWNDGNTDLIRTLELTQDTILTAEFAPNTYTITTVSPDTQRGTTQGDTIANYLDIITICANANYGYHFTQWNDANVDNPRQVQVTGDATYTATFDKNTYAISLSCNEEQGSVEGVTSAEYLDTVTISATPNFGYHFVQWSDRVTDNPRTLILTQDTTFTAEFAQTFSGQCGDNLYWELIETTLHITGSGEMYNYTSDTAPWKLLVSSIKSLTIAEDVTSIERSAFSNCPALESVVWNAKNYVNPANKEAAPFYDIRSQIKSFTFGENVEHIPAYLCYGMDKLTSVTTPNSLKTIGTSAFEGCARLAKISLGTGLEEIAANAFAGCTRLYDIYVYATYPPFADESSFANYNVYVYIPCEYQRDYILDVVWGKFKFIECLESEDVTTDGNVTIVPGYNDVTITWPTEDNADTYTIVIKKDGEVFCTLTFNSEGQLLNIAFAPGRDGKRPAQYAEQAVNGYRFTVTGLDEGSAYIYELVIKDNGDNVLQTYSGEFRTQSTDDRTVTVKYDTMQGEVIGAGTYLLGDTATLTAIPNEGYRFVGWTDGNADNPRTLVVTQDTTLTAIFEVLTYDVTVTCDPTQGTVTGFGTYNHGDVATLTAIPNEGYRFVGWTDGNADNPRTLVVTQDTTLTALFEVATYDVTVTCDPTQGAVTGSGTYNHGDVATLTAIPNEGYRFVRWSNEVEDNPYIFVISEDVTLSAEFEEIIPSSVENTNSQSPTSNCQKILYEDHIYILCEGKVYSVMGQEIGN